MPLGSRRVALVAALSIAVSASGGQPDYRDLLTGPPSGLVSLSPRYQKPYDFGIPVNKVIDSADRVARDVYQKVDHHGGKTAAYWRDLVFKTVDETIATFDYVPSNELRDFLLAHGSIAFIRSTFAGEVGGEITLPHRILNPKNIELYANAWLGDPNPRGGCATTNMSLLYFFKGIVKNDTSKCGTVVIGEQFVRKSVGDVSPRHDWAWIQIGSKSDGFILQSDPHWCRIQRSDKKKVVGVTDWGTAAAGWLPITTEVFFATHFSEMNGKYEPYTNGHLPPASLRWSPMTVEEWKTIDWAKFVALKQRTLDAYDSAVLRRGNR